MNETAPFNPLDFIMTLESGGIKSRRKFVEGMVALKNSGVIYELQGTYHRTYQDLINTGLVHREQLPDGTLIDVPNYDRIELFDNIEDEEEDENYEGDWEDEDES
jgi:hypothetical protein